MNMAEASARFFSMADPAVRVAVAGGLCMGALLGLLGVLLSVRKLALFGDTLAHSVLPGVALGFLAVMDKNPVTIFLGALGVGLLGALAVEVLPRTAPIRQDSALAIVLAGFYGVGITLLTVIQNLAPGNQAGLNAYLLGQAAALGEGDVAALAALLAGCAGLLALFYKEVLAVSFDPAHARATGLPVLVTRTLLIALLTAAIVASLRAAGAVLVAALLILPAAAGRLWTHRLPPLFALAAVLGAVSGFAGVYASFLVPRLPTGPLMVLAAGALFFGSLLLAPQRGYLPHLLRAWRRRGRIARENTLKALWQGAEAGDWPADADKVPLGRLAVRLNEAVAETGRRAESLVRGGLAEWRPATGPMTADRQLVPRPEAWRRARQIVRNHRLWELYLTHAAQYRSDHVHDDAEEVEHMLDEELVQLLEKRLDAPATDPHGKPIPT